jgi:hypothetical protein
MPDESFFGVPSDAMEIVVKLNLNGTILPTQVSDLPRPNQNVPGPRRTSGRPCAYGQDALK